MRCRVPPCTCKRRGSLCSVRRRVCVYSSCDVTPPYPCSAQMISALAGSNTSCACRISPTPRPTQLSAAVRPADWPMRTVGGARSLEIPHLIRTCTTVARAQKPGPQMLHETALVSEPAFCATRTESERQIPLPCSRRATAQPAFSPP